jgi:hypothetical protein
MIRVSIAESAPSASSVLPILDRRIPILQFIYRLRELTRSRDHQSLTDDVDYALQNAHINLDIARAAQIDLSRANILENWSRSIIRPATGFGQLWRSSDRRRSFPKRWDQNYHPEFYRQFRAKWDVLTLVPNFTEARV